MKNILKAKNILKIFEENSFLKNLAFSLVNLPIIGSFYKKIYKTNINRKLKNFDVSNLIVSIEAMNVCNSSCIMCPYQKMTRKKEIMPMSLFFKIVDDCLIAGIRNFNLNFYNEPFLDPLIFERIKYLKSKEVNVDLFSNGSVIDENKINDIFDSGIDRIRFSVDAVKKGTYESIRRGLSFEITINNILNLIKKRNQAGLKKPRVNVVFVRQELNEGELEDFLSFWKNRADKVIISFDDNRNETSAFFKKPGRNLVAFPCRKLWTEIVVMSNGKVSLCCVDYDGQVVLGDFNKQNLKEIWENSKFTEIRDMHLNFQSGQISICKNCVHSYRMNLKSWW